VVGSLEGQLASSKDATQAGQDALEGKEVELQEGLAAGRVREETLADEIAELQSTAASLEAAVGENLTLLTDLVKVALP